MMTPNETSQATAVFAFLLVLRQLTAAPEVFRWGSRWTRD
jgi:hypothetical protein